ncbi:hypothetical protein [Pseudogulbenkiania sp. MAI-1]|uniref:hypothetical protein n=1 Tax=Pseudogulbenkiania sp. MAI-1 TaxID=990370 RepID=UPI0012EB24B7|nr:hypothetical protein [Pseudogulbenkiania sp. MAI-1]
MAGAKSKVTPAAPAEGEAQQDAGTQIEQQQAADAATPPVDPQNADQGVASDNQVEQEPAPQVEQHAALEPTPTEALAGLFEPNAIEVVAKCESFRRAGRVFTRTASTIRLADLTEDEFKLLYEEPMLAVQLTHLAEED